MCLYTKKTEPMVATEPIRCLKVVRTLPFGEGYQPLFYFYGDMVYEVGREYAVGNVFNILKIDRRCKFQKIKRGFHSYTLNNPNVRFLFMSHMEGGISCAVLECEIPEGSRYFYGYANVCHTKDEDGFFTETAYCSERLKIIRRLSYQEIENIGKEKLE